MFLYYNDYNEEQQHKRMAIYHMVRHMNTRFQALPAGQRFGATHLIDVIGMQAHYHVGGSGAAYIHGVNVNNVFASFNQFRNLVDDGLLRAISITELDITVGNTGNAAGGNVNRPAGTPPTQAQLRQQATMYAQLFQFFRANSSHIRRVSLWGIDDPGSWRHRGSPHLWDAQLRPKMAFWAVADPASFLANPDDFAPGRTLQQMRASASNIPASAWN